MTDFRTTCVLILHQKAAFTDRCGIIKQEIFCLLRTVNFHLRSTVHNEWKSVVEREEVNLILFLEGKKKTTACLWCLFTG